MPVETRKGKGAYYTITLQTGKRPWRMYFGKADSVPAKLAQTMMAIRKIDVELAHRDLARSTIHKRSRYLRKKYPPVSKPESHKA